MSSTNEIYTSKMTSESLLSVIIPAYNAVDTIEKCISSVCEAFGHSSDVEILIIDDGSTDDTSTIVNVFIAKYDSGCNLKLFKKGNGGVSSARNFGIDNAVGQWVMFVDSDDELSVNTLKELKPFLNNSFGIQNTSLVNFAMLARFKTGDREFSLPDEIVSVRSVLTSNKNDLLRGLILCSPCNKVYNTSLLKRCGIKFPEDVKIGEDFIFNTLYYHHVTDVKLISTPLYYYNCYNEQSAIGKFYPNFDSFINSMTSAYNRLLASKQINSPEAFAIRNQFISDRWLFATQRCIESSLSIFEQKKTLIRWYKSIESQYLDSFVKMCGNKYHILPKAYINKRSLFIPLLHLKLANFYTSLKSKLYRLF